MMSTVLVNSGAMKDEDGIETDFLCGYQMNHLRSNRVRLR